MVSFTHYKRTEVQSNERVTWEIVGLLLDSDMSSPSSTLRMNWDSVLGDYDKVILNSAFFTLTSPPVSHFTRTECSQALETSQHLCHFKARRTLSFVTRLNQTKILH